MKKKLIDAEAWLAQGNQSWMNYNLAKKIIREAPCYEVEEALLTPCEGSKQTTDGSPYPGRGDAAEEAKPAPKACRCRACGAKITWVKMPSGKKMPCDAERVRYRADPAGRESFVTERGSIVRGVAVPDGESWGHISHFTTCPNAEEFRRQK